jgi:hypothetical protein
MLKWGNGVRRRGGGFGNFDFGPGESGRVRGTPVGLLRFDGDELREKIESKLHEQS